MGSGVEESVDSVVRPPWTAAFLSGNEVMARIESTPQH
jgi:hypothetical protein